MSQRFKSGLLPGYLGAAALLLAACGGEWEEYSPNGAALPADNVVKASYPVGPFGTKIGDVVADIKFKDALFDPEMFCKRTRDWDLGAVESGQSLSMSEVFQGDAFCGSSPKQFLLLMSTAGW